LENRGWKTHKLRLKYTLLHDLSNQVSILS